MCSLEVIAACFSLSGIYLNAGAVHSDGNPVRIYDAVESAELVNSLPANGGTLTQNNFSIKYKTVYEEIARNPLGRFAVGYSIDFSRKWSADLSYAREWSTKDDFKFNRYSASITWRPFAQ